MVIQYSIFQLVNPDTLIHFSVMGFFFNLCLWPILLSASILCIRRFTVLFSHGNAVDLGQMCSFYIGLGTRIKCNIFSYDYSGYGVSTGKPSEKNLYADIDAAWHALRTRYVFIYSKQMSLLGKLHTIQHRWKKCWKM